MNVKKLLTLLLLLSSPVLRAERAGSTDQAFSVEVPPGWKVQAPRPGYLLQLSPPGGKGGFTLAPAAGVADDNQAQAALRALGGEIAGKLKVKFGAIRRLNTPQPGRMYFGTGPMGGSEYLLGIFFVDGKWYRVDLLAPGAADSANVLLSSLMPGPPPAAPKNRGDLAASTDGRFTVPIPKGWTALPAKSDSEVLLRSAAGDILSIAFEPKAAGQRQTEKLLADWAPKLAAQWKVAFSPIREMDINGRPFQFVAGHAEEELVDTAVAGIFIAEGQTFRIATQCKGTRPLDVAQRALDAFRLKGEENQASKPPAPDLPPPPQEAPGAKVPEPKNLQTASEGYSWGLLAVLVAVPLFGLLGYGIYAARKKPL